MLSGVPSDHMDVLGSARYCDEWLEIYHSILPPVSSLPPSGKLRIVYMDHGPQYRTNADEIVESLKAVANLDFVEMIVKVSPRGHISDERLRDFFQLDSTTHSIHLIRWADVVITFMSSIVLEAFFHRKVFLYPAYFHRNTMHWEEYGACWKVSDVSELLEALRSLNNGSAPAPYQDENVKALLSDFVYGGREEADVLGNYAQFICAGEKMTSKTEALRH